MKITLIAFALVVTLLRASEIVVPNQVCETETNHLNKTDSPWDFFDLHDYCSATGEPGCAITCEDGQTASCFNGLMECIGCGGNGENLAGTPGVCTCE